jgi:hypothetical protein
MTLQRLVRKAEADHKKTEVQDGILTIDEVAVFSIKDGFLQVRENGDNTLPVS